jgi:hypothetical protein
MCLCAKGIAATMSCFANGYACVFARCDLEGNGDNELCVQGREGYSKRVGNTKRVTLCRVVVLTRWICVCKASCV